MKNLEHLTLIYSSEWILCWTHSSMSMSFLHWGAQHWLQPSSYGLTRNEKRRITPLDLQTLFFLVQPRMLLALFATRAQEKIITEISSPLWTISTVQLDFSNVLLEDKFPTRMKVSLKGSQQNGKHSLYLGIWSMLVSFLWLFIILGIRITIQVKMQVGPSLPGSKYQTDQEVILDLRLVISLSLG